MRTKLSIIVLTFAVTRAFLPAALAQSPSSPPATEITAAPVSAPAATSDPNLDRGFLQPTAMTQPKGTLTYNNYELLLHGITYGVTDRVQTSLTVLSPITTEMPFLGIAAVKGRVFATERVHVAVQGSLGYLRAFDTGSDSAYSLGAGAFASVCVRDDCSSLLSASANYQLVMPSSTSQRGHVFIYGGSLVHRVGAHVKLLAEVTSAAVSTSTDNWEGLNGFLGSYGLRFYTGNLAGDVGFVKPFVSESDGGLLMGLPFVSVSYRWM
jgi:hypothetical protein